MEKVFNGEEREVSMEDIIKLALSYDLASDLHENWRLTRLKEDGTYEPRMKKSKDEEWNKKHNTDDVDIANTTFAELPSNWQYENLEAAKVVIELVYDKLVYGKQITLEDFEKMASVVHEKWLSRNNWVYGKEDGNPTLAVSYDLLPKEEKEKDREQIDLAIRKVTSYMLGKVDANKLIEQYNITIEETKKTKQM